MFADAYISSVGHLCSNLALLFLLHANLRGEGRGFKGPLCHLNFGLDIIISNR